MATDPLKKKTPEAPEEPADAAAGGPTCIEFKQVVKRFGDNTVLDHLDFTVDRGERVTLIGPSGSGKTTILRLLMTLEKVTEGVIEVDGRPFSHMPGPDGKLRPANEKYLRDIRKRIGMVFQQFNLFPNMSVLQNITEAPVHVLGTDKDEAATRAKELLDMVGLADKVDAHPTQLSGGQQQRVAIARALAMQPEILLLDEVTSALDPELVADVLDVLRDVARSTDISMLIVTHEMRFARDVSNRVLMFDRGRIVESGGPEQIFGAPEHDRTKQFLKAVLDDR